MVEAALLALLAAAPVHAQDAMPEPLSTRPGDPARGRALVADRQRSLCLLCHAAPLPEAGGQGDLAPSLAGAGARLTPGQLRLRLVDSQQLNPDSIMPPYHRTTGLTSVGRAWQGKPILSAEEIEDVIAYLTTLRD